MEMGDRGSKQIETGGRVMGRKFTSGLMAIILLAAVAGFLHAQEAPEPPEPPEPPETQVFVMNDGTAHLGVTLSDVSSAKAQELKLPAIAGAIVDSVQKGSAAAKAGIKAHDAIIEFDGVRVRSSAELRRLIRETPPGRTVAIKVVRDGKTQVLSAQLESASNHFEFNMPEIKIPPMNFSYGMPGMGSHRPRLGISSEEITPQLAQYFGVKEGKGVLIFEVTKGGAADKAGLKAGDVIVRVDDKSIATVEELREALNEDFTGDTRKIRVTIVRDHHEQTVDAELTQTHQGEKHTSSIAGPPSSTTEAAYSRALARMQAQAAQFGSRAESQRALVQSEVMKQQKHLKEEWQRELRDQMLTLKDQLKQQLNLQVAVRKEGEI